MLLDDVEHGQAAEVPGLGHRGVEQEGADATAAVTRGDEEDGDGREPLGRQAGAGGPAVRLPSGPDLQQRHMPDDGGADERDPAAELARPHEELLDGEGQRPAHRVAGSRLLRTEEVDEPGDVERLARADRDGGGHLRESRRCSAVASVPVTTTPTIGVLAVQGDVREHLAALEAGGAHAVRVRRPSEVAAVDGLVLPGGESTTIDKLVRAFDLQRPLRERIADGLPVYGSCAGMILLADRLADGAAGQQTLGGMDILVRRNAFGRQVDSFEEDLHIRELGGEPVRAVFIRAPWVEEAGEAVEVLARVEDGPAAGRIVAARQRNLLVTSFHPEMTGDHRVHQLFVDIVRQSLRERS